MALLGIMRYGCRNYVEVLLEGKLGACPRIEIVARESPFEAVFLFI